MEIKYTHEYEMRSIRKSSIKTMANHIQFISFIQCNSLRFDLTEAMTAHKNGEVSILRTCCTTHRLQLNESAKYTIHTHDSAIHLFNCVRKLLPPLVLFASIYRGTGWECHWIRRNSLRHPFLFTFFYLFSESLFGLSKHFRRNAEPRRDEWKKKQNQ